MAITTTQAATVQKLVACMFNIAADSANYTSAVGAYEAAGNNLSTLANNLSYHAFFNMGVDNAAKAATLLSNIGLTTGTTAGDTAYNFFIGQLNANVKIEQIAVQAVTYLENDTTRDAMFNDSALVLANKATVAQSFIDSKIVATTAADLNVISNVTSDANTVTTSKAAITTTAATPLQVVSIANVAAKAAATAASTALDATTLLAGKTVYLSGNATGSTFNSDLTLMDTELVYGVSKNTLYINDAMKADNDYADFVQLLEANSSYITTYTPNEKLYETWFYNKSDADASVGKVSTISKNIFTLTSADTVDTIYVHEGNSIVTAYDTITNFQVQKSASSGISGTSNDKLDLASSTIASNASNVDGIDFGTMTSHTISNGWITFNGTNSNANITSTTLIDTIGYLSANIIIGDTVEFAYSGNTYVFQGGATSDTMVEITGVTGAYIGATAAADTILIV